MMPISISQNEQPSTAATPQAVELVFEIKKSLPEVMVGGGDWLGLADLLSALAEECRGMHKVTIDVEDSE